MAFIDLLFALEGPTLPIDHGYDLYSALSRLVPVLHGDVPWRVAPIRGSAAVNGVLKLDRRYSRLRVRLPAEDIPEILALAGKTLEIGAHRVRLGIPQVSALIPTPSLVARLVTIKVSKFKRIPEPAEFLAAARRQLDTLAVAGEAGIPLVEAGPHTGKPRRRVLRVKEKTVVGFPLRVTGLTAEESITLQENGVGGRSKMGCGFFLPVKA